MLSSVEDPDCQAIGKHFVKMWQGAATGVCWAGKLIVTSEENTNAPQLTTEIHNINLSQAEKIINQKCI